MGVQEPTAQLYIVIHCDKRVAKRVKNFFNQKHVLEDLKSDFQVHVVDTGLVSLAGLRRIKAQSDAAGRRTMCGTKNILGWPKSLVCVRGNHWWPHYGRSSHQEGYIWSHSTALDIAGWKDDAKPPIIGYVDLLPAAQVNYDWGLISGLDMPAGNFLCHHELSKKGLFCGHIVSLGRRETRRVVVMDSRGYRHGTLAANGSTMVSTIGKAFVYASDFVTDAESGK